MGILKKEDFLRKLAVYLPDDLFTNVEALAKIPGLPLSIFVRLVLAEYVRCQNPTNADTATRINTPVQPPADEWIVHSNKLLRVRD